MSIHSCNDLPSKHSLIRHRLRALPLLLVCGLAINCQYLAAQTAGQSTAVAGKVDTESPIKRYTAGLRPHERWIWTELIGFDNQQPDLGVGEYLSTAQFRPTAICLLIGSPDFVLSHPGIEQELDLPDEYCSRDGHEFNPQRKRQQWTNYQLRALISELRKQGVQTYLSTFATYSRDPSHREWISDHLEVLHVRKSSGYAWALNCLTRLKDGIYFEEIFAKKMVKTLRDYGFTGWHGADGWGPLSGPIHEVSFADDMIAQFADNTGLSLPDVVTQKCVYDVPKLTARADWILKHKRAEWSQFYADRWTRFWKTMVTALHKNEKKAVINSAWGRAPFEAYYRYGVNYKGIVDAGVDGIIVETVAAGLAMDPRLANTDRHDDFLAMLMLMRANTPKAKLIFLHSVHDVVEEWDAVHHIPMVLEREIYALSNVFHTHSDGIIKPSVNGFLACLGDGLSSDDWSWLKTRWQLAYSKSPIQTHGATVVWSDTAFRAQMADFLKTRTWNTHHLLFRLMEAGATVQNTINIKSLAHARGALLVPNAHLLPAEELTQVLNYQDGPVVLVGQKIDGITKPNVEFNDSNSSYPLWCGIYNAQATVENNPADDEAKLAAEPESFTEPKGYWDHLTYRKVSPRFVQTCADAIQQVSTPIKVIEQKEAAALMPVELANGHLRIAIKNRKRVYAKPQIDIGYAIESVTVRSGFPSVTIRPKGSTFHVRVPGRGITVVDVVRKED